MPSEISIDDVVGQFEFPRKDKIQEAGCSIGPFSRPEVLICFNCWKSNDARELRYKCMETISNFGRLFLRKVSHFALEEYYDSLELESMKNGSVVDREGSSKRWAVTGMP